MTFDILIPVWGELYIERFAKLCLRSLLSAENLPWLSQHYTVRLIILTSSNSHDFFLEQPPFVLAQEVVSDVVMMDIDDLIEIYGGNYSTILTHAYSRAMNTTEYLGDTNYIFLVADLVFSDGALREVASAMESGSDACLMCSPRVDASFVEPLLECMGTDTKLTLSGAELVEQLIQFPHPTLVAKTVENNLISLSIAHQFFWKPEPKTLIARCFLLHMLCIRPTHRPPYIASPCDYGFITELVPDGRWFYLEDSDRFMAIEVQDPRHEIEYIKTYPLEVEEIAEGLSHWTTEQHRKFVNATFVFRAAPNEINAEDAKIITESYVKALVANLSPPVDHRFHHFWLGSVGAVVLQSSDLYLEKEESIKAVPKVLGELIEKGRLLRSVNRVDIAISSCKSTARSERILVSQSNLAVWIRPDRLHLVAQDLAFPGSSTIIVLEGDIDDFVKLFSQRNYVSNLFDIAGPNRTVLLCYDIRYDEFRTGSHSRRHLFAMYAEAANCMLARGIVTQVYDLSSSPLDAHHGMVIEVTRQDPIMR